MKVRIIIPCFNEEESLPQLFEKLGQLESELTQYCDYHFCFVDDGSSDNTKFLIEKFISETDHILKVHSKNKNLGAALKTGLSNLSCDYVVFLDSDCTYEPKIILHLIQELNHNYDLVTVSPYHPKGLVEGVPAWRLILSKSLSCIYRIILKKYIYTFTAMVRGIRVDKIDQIMGISNDFSFVAEMMIKAIKNGLNIQEIPTTLKIRKFGQSKMNIIKTIKSHLKIIFNLLVKKI